MTGRNLGLWDCCEQLGVEELIPAEAVEQLGKTHFAMGSWLNVGLTGGATAHSPPQESLGDKLRPVHRLGEGRCEVEARELLHRVYQVLGLAAPPNPDRQTEAAVLIDHAQDLTSYTIGARGQLEVNSSHLVRTMNPISASPSRQRGMPTSDHGRGPFQTSLPTDQLPSCC